MAGLSGSRNTPELQNLGAYHRLVGIEAATTVYVGGMVAFDANGLLVPAQPLGAAPLNVLQVPGVAIYTYAGGIMPPGINGTNLAASAALFPNVANVGVGGAISMGVKTGVFGMDNDASITALNVGQLAFAIDDHTVGIADGSGATTVPNTTSLVVPAAAPLINVLKPYIQPGSFNAYSATGGGGTKYVENTDYAVDYQGGLFITLAGGAIAAGGTVFITYKYGKPTRVVAGEIVQIEGGLVYVNFMRQSQPATNAAALAN